MLDVIAINFSLMQITADIENRKIYPELDYWWKETDIPFSEIELMQYTGLKDKNGKEIFEGDIVATDLERPYLIVEKHRSYFLYNCNDGDDDYYDFMLPLRSYQDSQDYFAEIIGNIYENPELFKVEWWKIKYI